VRRYHGPDPSGRVTVFGNSAHIPEVLAYGPVQYQGLGIPNLYKSQGISHIERILKFSHIHEDITGQLIRASAEQLKLEIGCIGPTLYHSPTPTLLG
jgi:hypothetical protein